MTWHEDECLLGWDDPAAESVMANLADPPDDDDPFGDDEPDDAEDVAR